MGRACRRTFTDDLWAQAEFKRHLPLALPVSFQDERGAECVACAATEVQIPICVDGRPANEKARKANRAGLVNFGEAAPLWAPAGSYLEGATRLGFLRGRGRTAMQFALPRFYITMGVKLSGCPTSVFLPIP